MKIVFMGTPDFAVPTLEEIVKAGHEVSLVISQPDRRKGRGKKLQPTEVKAKALELGLEVYQPDSINSEESQKRLEEIKPDVAIVVAYGQILRQRILDIPKYGCINVHGSLLPGYRGAAPINWAIIRGEKKTGVTTMFMERGLDSGDMLLKAETEIGKEETAGELYGRLMHMGGKLLVETLKELEEGTLKREKQDHDKATYAPTMDKTLGKIDWNKTYEEIDCLVRGTNPWPGSYAPYKDKSIKVFKTIKKARIEGYENGEVFKVNSEGIHLNAKDATVVITEFQFPGKKRMKVSEFLKGNEFEIGIKLI